MLLQETLRKLCTKFTPEKVVDEIIEGNYLSAEELLRYLMRKYEDRPFENWKIKEAVSECSN